jgi:hypothetical protein
VERGTDGAISLWGVLFSVVGGLVIGGSQRALLAGAVLGFLGSMFDSLLGTLQSPASLYHGFTNALVNLLSACLTLAVAPLLFEFPALLAGCSLLVPYVVFYLLPGHSRATQLTTALLVLWLPLAAFDIELPTSLLVTLIALFHTVLGLTEARAAAKAMRFKEDLKCVSNTLGAPVWSPVRPQVDSLVAHVRALEGNGPSGTAGPSPARRRPFSLSPDYAPPPLSPSLHRDFEADSPARG